MTSDQRITKAYGGEDQEDSIKDLILELVKRKRSLPILKTGAPDSCRSCGACCVHYEGIDVKADDPNLDWLDAHDLIEDMPRGFPAFREEDERSPFRMRRSEGKRCIALIGEVGKAAHCGIYDHRPSACREYPAGEARCRNSIILEIFRKRDPECLP